MTSYRDAPCIELRATQEVFQLRLLRRFGQISFFADDPKVSHRVIAAFGVRDDVIQMMQSRIESAALLLKPFDDLTLDVSRNMTVAPRTPHEDKSNSDADQHAENPNPDIRQAAVPLQIPAGRAIGDGKNDHLFHQKNNPLLFGPQDEATINHLVGDDGPPKEPEEQRRIKGHVNPSIREEAPKSKIHIGHFPLIQYRYGG
jgi:hypothetical protein